MATKSPVGKAPSTRSKKISVPSTVTVFCPKSGDQEGTRELNGAIHCGYCGETGHAATAGKTAQAKIAKPTVHAVSTQGTITAEDRKGMSFTYEETEFPESTKAAKTATPNPHTSGVAAAIEKKVAGDTKGLGFKVANDDKEINRHKAWLRTAGSAAGVTIRIEQVPVEGDDTHVKLVFRAVDKITRTRKASVTPEVAEVATAEKTGF